MNFGFELMWASVLLPKFAEGGRTTFDLGPEGERCSIVWPLALGMFDLKTSPPLNLGP